MNHTAVLARSELSLACAMAAHEVNRAWCVATGDFSQPTWGDAPDWAKKSALSGVIGVLEGRTPEESHASWWAEKIATGWTYGPEKDVEKKKHPCMVPYSELSPLQQAKDVLFVGTVRLLAEQFLRPIEATGDALTEETPGNCVNCQCTLSFGSSPRLCVTCAASHPIFLRKFASYCLKPAGDALRAAADRIEELERRVVWLKGSR
jgi:hypothetical protein